MRKARVKRFALYMINSYDGQSRCRISCYPQQKWNYCTDGVDAILERNGIKFWIPKEEFEQGWEVIE